MLRLSLATYADTPVRTCVPAAAADAHAAHTLSEESLGVARTAGASAYVQAWGAGVIPTDCWHGA